MGELSCRLFTYRRFRRESPSVGKHREPKSRRSEIYIYICMEGDSQGRLTSASPRRRARLSSVSSASFGTTDAEDGEKCERGSSSDGGMKAWRWRRAVERRSGGSGTLSEGTMEARIVEQREDGKGGMVGSCMVCDGGMDV